MIYIKLVQTHQTTNKQYTHILFMYNSDIQKVISISIDIYAGV
jgi:hypothetical protein